MRKNACRIQGRPLLSGKVCLAGTGAAVTRDIPDYPLAFGNPIRHVGWTCRCGFKFKAGNSKFSCPACGKAYIPMDKTILPVHEGDVWSSKDLYPFYTTEPLAKWSILAKVKEGEDLNRGIHEVF